MSHFLLALLASALVLATLPLALELLALTAAAAFGRSRPPEALAVSRPPLRLAVVIPAHNEEILVGRCVASVLASAQPTSSPSEPAPPFETAVFVVAHNCSDATAASAEAAGANILALDDPLQRGKGAALRHGFDAVLGLQADAVLLIDADSVVSANLIASVAAALRDGSRAVQCRYQVANAGDTARTRLMALALLGMNVLRPLGRSRLGLSCGIFGNGFALAADTLRLVPYTANSVVEDLEYHLHLVSASIRVDFLDHATVLGEMPLSAAGAATQRARWEGGRARIRREWSPRLLRSLLSGNLRAAEPLADLLALPLATQAVLLAVAMALPVPWLRIYALVAALAIAAYLLVAANLGGDIDGALRSLLAAPRFMLWKAETLAATRRAGRSDAAWVRTERDPNPETDLDTNLDANHPPSAASGDHDLNP